jgi:membrane protease YdiL (CAAX protease family)
MMSKVESRSPAALGLLPGRRASRDVLLGAGIGMCLVGVVCLAMLGAGWIESPAFAPNPTRWILRAMEVTGVVLVAAFTEELAVRGYPFQVLAENLGPVGATVLTATLFALLHGWNPGVGWIALGNTFLAGILLGIMYWRTLSLWLVTGAHFAWNWTMGVAVGLPVSGVHFDLPGPRVRALGPASLTGGAYGPEGGWLLGLVTLAGIVWMARTPLLSRDPEVVALGPLPCGPGPTFRPVRLSDQEPTEESTEDR